MAKQIKQNDVIQPNIWQNTIDSTKALISQVEILNKELSKTAKGSKKALSSNKTKDFKGLKEANTEIEKLNQNFNQKITIDKERIKLEQKLKIANSEAIQQNVQLKRLTQEQAKANKDLEIIQNKNAGTLERAAAVSRKLRREREKLNLVTDKGRKRLIEINKTLDKNNKLVSKNSDKLKKQKLNVGNYTNSTRAAIEQSGLFGRQIAILSRVQATLGALTKKNTAETTANAAAQKGATKATQGTSKALKFLRIALIATGIGAIVVALGALIAAFAGTQRGADAFTKVLRPLQALFQRFIGFLEKTAFKAFDKLKAAFTDPKQAVIDLADAIKNNLIKRFEALGVLGGAIAKLFKGEFAKGFEELANGAVQLSTGIEDASGKLRNFAEETGEFIDESIKQGEQLDKLIKRFERREIDLVLPLAQARLEFQKLRAIAQDQKKSDEERIEALKEAEKQQRFIARSEKELLDLRIAKIELEQSFNDTSREEELELANLKADRLRQEEQAQKKINGLISLRSGIELRADKIRKKQLEDTIKLTDKINESFIDDDFEKEIIGKLKKFDQLSKQIDENEVLSEKEKNELILNLTIQLQIDISEIEKKRIEDTKKKEKEALDAKITESKRVLKEIELAGLKAGKTEVEIAEEVSAKKIKLLEDEIEARKKLGQDTIDLELELAKATKKTIKDTNTFDKEAREKTLAVLKTLNDKYFSEKTEQADKEITDTKKRGEELNTLAAAGNKEAAESIGENQKAQAEANRKKEELLQKQKQFEIALALIQAFNSELDAGKTTGEALAGAITSTTVLTSVAGSLPAFYEGTEDTGTAGKLDNNGGFHAILHDNERVITKEQNAKMGGISNEEAANVIQDYNKGLLYDLNTINPPNLEINNNNWQTNEQILNRFDNLETQLKKLNDKPAYLGSDIDLMKKIITKSYQKGNTKTNINSKAPSVW